MLNSNTAKEQIFIAPEVKNALRGWFSVLAERSEVWGGQPVNGRAWRAELRRMPPPYGVLMCEGFAALRRELNQQMTLTAVDELALALFVSVAVHIKSENTELSFASQLGEEIKGRICLSRLRFERLQQAYEPDAFCLQLIRAVKLRDRGGNGVNVISLADGIFLWMREWQAREEHRSEDLNPFKRNRIRWASEYLAASGKK